MKNTIESILEAQGRDINEEINKEIKDTELAKLGYNPDGTIKDEKKIKNYDPINKKDYSHKEQFGNFVEKPEKVYNMEELEEFMNEDSLYEFAYKRDEEGEEKDFENQDIQNHWLKAVKKLKAIEAQKKAIEAQKKAKEEKEYYKEKRKKPYYTKEELALQEACLNYLRKDKKKKESPVYKGGELDLKGIQDMAIEGAIHKTREGEMFRDYFRIKKHKGKRQLSRVEVIKKEEKKEENKREVTTKNIIIKYIYETDDLPAGEYAYEINEVSYISNDCGFIIFRPKLMVNLDKRKKQDNKKIA